MNAIHKKRLLKLAEHLEKGKLGHKKFNFKILNADQSGVQLGVNGCGYSGCAIGECPTAFPRHWQWLDGWPVLRNGATCLYDADAGLTAAKEFFGLERIEANHLFLPEHQCPAFGGKRLWENATAKQVAKNIRAFVKRADALIEELGRE